MKTPHTPMTYEEPIDKDILEAFFNKNATYKRADARKIKKELRKLAILQRA